MADESGANLTLSAEQKAIADEFFDAGNFKEAVKFYTNAIDLEQTDFRLYGNRSLSYYNLQLYEEALKDAEKSLEISPRYLKGFVRKFRCLYKLGRTKEADETYGITRRFFPEYQDEINSARQSVTEPGQEDSAAPKGFFGRMAGYFRRRGGDQGYSDHRDSDSDDDSIDTDVITKTYEEEEPHSRDIRKRVHHE